MNSEKIYSDIYKDFFGDYEERKKNLEKEEIINVDYEEEISKLFIIDDSK